MDCKCGKCKFIINKYEHVQVVHAPNRRRLKAGVIIHNKKNNHVLIIQSRGNLWGFPKGSMEENETFIECAKRELREETSINLDVSLLKCEYKLSNNVRYYYVDTEGDYDNLEIPGGDNNDASGMCWIDLGCLQDLFVNKKISLNYHARNCLFHFFNISSSFKCSFS
jgi:hypothetical protein